MRAARLRLALLVLVGLVVMILWGAANLVWIVMPLMGSVMMSNDSGRAPESLHLRLIFGTSAAQIIVALAGIPLGLSVFWRGRRKMPLWLFCGMTLVGLIGPIAMFNAFFIGCARE